MGDSKYAIPIPKLNGHANKLWALLFALTGFLGNQVWRDVKENTQWRDRNFTLAATVAADHDVLLKINALDEYQNSRIDECKHEIAILRERLSRFEGTALGLGIRQEKNE